MIHIPSRISFFMRAISLRISERISPSSSFFSSWRSSLVTTRGAEAPGADADADGEAMLLRDAEAPLRTSCAELSAASAPTAPFFDAAISAGFLQIRGRGCWRAEASEDGNSNEMLGKEQRRGKQLRHVCRQTLHQISIGNYST